MYPLSDCHWPQSPVYQALDDNFSLGYIVTPQQVAEHNGALLRLAKDTLGSTFILAAAIKTPENALQTPACCDFADFQVSRAVGEADKAHLVTRNNRFD